MDSTGPAFAQEYTIFSGSHTDPDYLHYPSSFEMINSLSDAASPRMFGLPNAVPTTLSYYTTYATPSLSPRPFSPTEGISPAALSDRDLPTDLRRTRENTGTSGTGSPVSNHGTHLVHRRQKSASITSVVATSPIAIPTRKQRNTRVEDDFVSDDDLDHSLSLSSNDVVVQKRREEIRKQRIESEQRRRDELRDGFRKLKDVLPVTNQKPSKVSLLDRATTHIKQLEFTQMQLSKKMAELEAETARLRSMNETLMLSTAQANVERRNAAAASVPTPSF